MLKEKVSQAIDDVAHQGLLPPMIQEWSHEGRSLEMILHIQNQDNKEQSSKDARDVAVCGCSLSMYTRSRTRSMRIEQENSSSSSVGARERECPMLFMITGMTVGEVKREGGLTKKQVCEIFPGYRSPDSETGLP
jgi:hypothetical protein